MKFLQVLIIFCFLSLRAASQQTIDSGFIINLNQDTVKGFIRYSNESSLSYSLSFKTSLNSAFKEYTPADLYGFGMKRDIFRSLRFNNNSEDSIVRESAFVKLLVSGEYNLYSFMKEGRIFFLIQKDTTSYFLYDQVNSGLGEVIKEGNYQDDLRYIGSTCAKFQNQYQKVAFLDKSIAEFVFQVNQCLSGKAVNYYHKEKTVMMPVLFAGGLPLGDKSQLTADFSLRFIFPKMDNKTSLNIGVHYSSTTRLLNNYGGVTHPVVTTLQTDQIFSIPATLQYNVLTGRVQPYLYGGISGAFQKEDKGELAYHPISQQFGLAIVAGIGLEVKIIKGLFFKADWRYEVFLQYPAIGLSYRF